MVQVAEFLGHGFKEWVRGVGEEVIVEEARVGLGDELASWRVEADVVEAIEW